MPLQFQLNQAPFRYGLAEGTDPHQVPWGTLTRAENVVWKKSGRIEKRFGTTSLPRTIFGGGTIAAGARLFTRGTELCCTDGTYVYSYSANLSAWIQVDRAPDVGLTWSTLLDTYWGVCASDVGVSASGIMVHAWVTGDPTIVGNAGSLCINLLDATSGATVLSAPFVLGGCFGVRVLVSGTNAFVVTLQSGSMMITSVDLTTKTVNASTAVRADASSTSWDAMLIGSNIVIAYENNVNALKLYSYTYSAPATYTQAATGGITGETGNTFRSIAIDGVSSERIWVAYYVNSSTKVRLAAANTSTLAQTIAPFDVEAVSAANVAVSRNSSTTCLVGYSENTTGRAMTVQCTSAGAVTTSTRRGTFNARLVSRIFAIGSRWFACVADVPRNPSGTYVGSDTALVEVETSDTLGITYVPHRYCGRIDPLVGGISVDGTLTSAISVSATEAKVPVPFLSAAVQKGSNWRCGLRLADVTIGASLPADM